MSKRARWTYYHGDLPELLGVVELEVLGCDRFSEASGLAFHDHGNRYEIVYMENGKATWEVGGTLHTTAAGQLFHTRPNESHRASMNFIDPCAIWWMVFADPAGKESWLGLSGAELRRVEERLAELPRTVTVDPQILLSFRKLRYAITAGGALAPVLVRHYTLDILLHWLQHPAASPMEPNGMMEAMLALADMIAKEPARRWSVPELARAVSVSESHLYRLFRSVHGMPPAAFIERTRIDHACKLLMETAMPVTEVALELGFKTSQHFATVFKKYKGVTPTAWRKAYAPHLPGSAPHR